MAQFASFLLSFFVCFFGILWFSPLWLLAKPDLTVSKVRVAMRLPGGGRVQASFSAETSLHGLLQWWAGRGELAPGIELCVVLGEFGASCVMSDE